MKKETIINRIIALVLAITAMFSVNVTSAFAADTRIDSALEYIDVIPDEIHEGDIIGSDSEKAIVIEVNEDGSFKTMKISESTYASVRCNHYNWIQITNPIYKGKRRVNNNIICYYNVYSAVYRCANKRCTARRNIDTSIPVKHIFKNNKCTVCERKKK